jgi:hypothetical protein
MFAFFLPRRGPIDRYISRHAYDETAGRSGGAAVTKSASPGDGDDVVVAVMA